jgi:hypothetical protein
LYSEFAKFWIQLNLCRYNCSIIFNIII